MSTRIHGGVDAARRAMGIIVLANRAPLRVALRPDGRVSTERSASGLVTALEPLVARRAGTWVAHGASTDGHGCVDRRDGLHVPPANPRYRLRYVRLPEDEHRGYYLGFANEGLWPLCHAVGVEPTFRSDDFRMYHRANARFAAAVVDEADSRSPLVFVQDYHFALAPRMLRRRLPASTIVAFWHIPWPTPRVLATCPWRTALLDGLLASDIVGFQTPDDCRHFIDAVEASLDAEIDRAENEVTFGGHTARVRAYPVGIDWSNAAVSAVPSPAVCRAEVMRRLRLPEGVRIGVGVDRLDYTKGINEKFLAVERLLERQPALRGRFVFVQVAEPSRECLPAYQAARAELVATSQRINARFESEGCAPIVLLEEHHEPAEVYRLYRAADFCYVGSLHDGMNLVAKEFVCARSDGRGVLVLSRFAGAARQLGEALIVNPRAIDRATDALAEALEMAESEQSRRMQSMRANVATFDSHWWAEQLLRDAARPRVARRSSVDSRLQAYTA
jgi:trehalose 6-phosphate synthase